MTTTRRWRAKHGSLMTKTWRDVCEFSLTRRDGTKMFVGGPSDVQKHSCSCSSSSSSAALCSVHARWEPWRVNSQSRSADRLKSGDTCVFSSTFFLFIFTRGDRRSCSHNVSMIIYSNQRTWNKQKRHSQFEVLLLFTWPRNGRVYISGQWVVSLVATLLLQQHDGFLTDFLIIAFVQTLLHSQVCDHYSPNTSPSSASSIITQTVSRAMHSRKLGNRKFPCWNLKPFF